MNKNIDTKKTEVDIIVLGVGTCGEDLSLRLLGAGFDVVGIEAALVGGECAYWACLPSKMMIRAANLLQEARRVDGMAGRVEITPDWNMVAARVRNEATGGWDDSIAVGRFEKNGGTLIHGYGKLSGKNSVTVGEQSFTSRRGIVIATGSKPHIPEIKGLSDVDYWTTHDVIAADKLPESLVVLGGGAVGCELGQVLSRFGVKVTIIEAGSRLLPSEEPEASDALTAAFSKEGIKAITNTTVDRVEKSAGSIVLTLRGNRKLVCERLLVAAGRTVDLSSLGLESVGLDGKAAFLDVNEKMQVADGIWAMGDVTGKGMFTHVALYQSAIVAANFLGIDHAPARYETVPRAVFTDPEIGSVGLTEKEAKSKGVDVLVLVKQVPATFRGWLHGSGSGILKFIIDRNKKILVGATAVGPGGAEILGFLELAVYAKVPLDKLRNMIYAFPTFYGGIGESLEAYGRGLSTVIDPTYKGFTGIDML